MSPVSCALCPVPFMKNRYTHGSLTPFLDIADLEFPVDWARVFGDRHPLEVEIGFGTGEYLVGLATTAPACNFIGFEQCKKRTIKTLRKLHDGALKNARLLVLDASWGFEYLFAPASVRKVHCLFPCPWPKKRHAKHRLFQPDVLRLIHGRLVSGGELVIVTDHEPYAEWIAQNVSADDFFLIRETVPARFDTKFERKWSAAGQAEFFKLVLTKKNVESGTIKEIRPLKTYFLEDFNASKAVFDGESGLVSIQFSDFMFDAGRKKGMIHSVVTEEGRSQHLWITIAFTSKGWCIAPADGSSVLPTEGVQRALALVYEAAARSNN